MACSFTDAAESTLRQTSYPPTQGCEILRTPGHDGLHVPWGSECGTRQIRNVFESC